MIKTIIDPYDPDGGSASSIVSSVNQKTADATGNVALTAADVGAATAAQGAKADSAVQPDSLKAVALTGSYNDLVDKPAIPSSASDVGAATAAQGAKADTAVQPSFLNPVAITGSYSDLADKPNIPTTAADVGAVAIEAVGNTDTDFVAVMNGAMA